MDPVLAILIVAGLVYIIAESVNEFQKDPELQGDDIVPYMGGVATATILGVGLVLVPAYIGEWFFGTLGWISGFVFGIIASMRFGKFLTRMHDGSLDYNLEDRIAGYKKGQIPLSFSNVTMAVVLYGGLFYMGATITPGTGYLSAAIGGLIGLLAARLIVYKFNSTVLGWMEAEAAKNLEEQEGNYEEE